MKKIFSLLLAALLCFGCFSALAEDIDLTGVEIPQPGVKDFSEAHPVLQSDAMIAVTSHIVSVTENTITVTTNGIEMTFDFQKAGGGYLCLTQDVYASLASYLRYSSIDNAQKWMIDSEICLYLEDEFTGADNYVFLDGSDELCTVLGDLKTLPSAYLEQFIASAGMKVVICNDRPWFYTYYADENITMCSTITNSQYVKVQVDGTIDDAQYILEALTVSAAQ